MRNVRGLWLGKIVVEAVAWMVGKIRELAYADLQGRYHQFKGVPIDMVDGERSERWLSLTDVRRVVKHLPSCASLRHAHPRGVRCGDGPSSERIEARTLVSLLAKAHDPRTRRFLFWLEREVIFPAEKKVSMQDSME